MCINGVPDRCHVDRAVPGGSNAISITKCDYFSSGRDTSYLTDMDPNIINQMLLDKVFPFLRIVE